MNIEMLRFRVDQGCDRRVQEIPGSGQTLESWAGLERGDGDENKAAGVEPHAHNWRRGAFLSCPDWKSRF